MNLDEADNTVYRPIPIEPFKKNSENLTFPQMIVHAINAKNGKATLIEIVNWVRENFEKFNNMALESVKVSIMANLSDHTAFFSKKMIKDSKSVSFWSVHRFRWFGAQKRKKSAKVEQKAHIVKKKK